MATVKLLYSHVILPEQSISKIIFITQGHLQGQKVKFKVR